MIQTENIEINDEFKRALGLIESGKNILITGRAGTGKSTLLSYFRKTTKKKIATLAPTGVAAVNIEGQTIHSFFRFGPDVSLDKIRKADEGIRPLYNAIETIVIDEISMVRSDLLDCVDKFLKLNRDNKNPFGGVQVVFFGDLYQLPPVITGREKAIFAKQYKSQYFFDSRVFENLDIEFVELEKIYRQKDKKFIEILNAIRNNSVKPVHIHEINKRVDPFFEPKSGDLYINLTTTNEMADEVNRKALSKIKSKTFYYRGKVKGRFDRKYLPTEIDLNIKKGAQVMLLNNDPAGRWVNGTVGRITGIEPGKKYGVVVVETNDGRRLDVMPYTWKIYSMVFNRETGNIDSEAVGSFTQYPIKLAWAVTIHKGQGKTFDKVVIDIGRGTFAHGQMYVALSRCTALDGIVLKRPVQEKHIFADWRISKFLTGYQYRQSEKKISLKEKIKIIEKAIDTNTKLYITYLKANDEKSRRIVLPKKVGQMEYMGKKYTGVEAYCFSKEDDRIFRVDKILDIREA